MKSPSRLPALPLALILFLFVRIPLLLALPYDGLRGYSDLQHFFNLASIPGAPFINFWVEYPPGFAFLNELIFFLTGGVEHSFTYLLIVIMLAADIGSVLVFGKIEKLLYPTEQIPTWRSLIFAALIAGFSYSWWYFDSMAVFFSLLTVYFVIANKNSIQTGAVLGLGIIVKVFPILLIPAVVRSLKLRRSISIVLAALGLAAAPYMILYAISPAFTAASIQSQFMRGSTATIWALLDGNYQTGNFGPLVERLDPATAAQPNRKPALVSPFLFLGIVAAAGLYLFLKARLDSPHRILGFYGLTLVLFFLWSPGWSPQWVLHLIPIALLVLPISPGLLIISTLILINLLEWPLLLSRGLFQTYPLTILLRLFLLILLGVSFYQVSKDETVKSTLNPAGS